MSTNCIYCQLAIRDENKSIEHVIPQALGGVLTIKNVCKKCNNSFGSDLDKHLVDLMQETAIVLNVNRYRGKNPNIQYEDKSSGDLFILRPNKGINAASKISRISEDKYKIYYKDNEDLEKSLEELGKRGNKNLQPDNDSSGGYANPNIVFRFSTGDRVQLRAIAKIAFEFYLALGGDFQFVKHLIPYIQGYAAAFLVFPDYKNYPSKEELWDEEITHSIEIIGGPQTKQLVCKISLFETWNYIVFLSDSFYGHNTYFKHVQNVKGKILENSIEEDKEGSARFISRQDYHEIADYDLFVIQSYNTRLQKLFLFETLRPYFDKELDQDYLGYPKGTLLTKAVAKEIVLKSIKENRLEITDYDDSRFQR
ncbi:HNH endonuclease [Leptospira santarosai]|uniref:HNH endonuclease n=1 Tax=Leptospira santarosai str. MOR084 TaxID=1049984 RepID=A0A0E2B9J2_9LEPT|nr:HNH endonuclease [Leptospira santarosai]EKO32018.1 HNH endonuclease [Leptospira santarosai str. MOR084]